MSGFRDNVLYGFDQASRINRKYNADGKYITSGGRFDVIKLAADLGVPVMQRELDGLLGAYLPFPSPGILLNTRRPQSVQRLTCAHELGHYFLSHDKSLDGENDVGFALVQTHRASPQEVQADAFAFSLLMPKWLIIENLKRLNQKYFSLEQKVYQLSLRLGCSYEATVNMLVQYKMLPSMEGHRLRSVEPKAIKISLVGNIEVENWRRDVWVISDLEDGSLFDVMRGDIVLIKTMEQSGSGFLNGYELKGNFNAFTVMDERHLEVGLSGCEEKPVGGAFIFELVSAASATGVVTARFFRRRPWIKGDSHEIMELVLDVGEVVPGLSIAERTKMVRNLRQSND